MGCASTSPESDIVIPLAMYMGELVYTRRERLAFVRLCSGVCSVCSLRGKKYFGVDNDPNTQEKQFLTRLSLHDPSEIYQNTDLMNFHYHMYGDCCFRCIRVRL